MRADYEAEIELPNGDGLPVNLVCRIEPPVRGSGYMYSAASDADYYGEGAHVSGVERIMVCVPGGVREPTVEETRLVMAWVEDHARDLDEWASEVCA